jgi:hypothetical protein
MHSTVAPFGASAQTGSTVENTTSGHVIMIDEPQWLADTLMKAA